MLVGGVRRRAVDGVVGGVREAHELGGDLSGPSGGPHEGGAHEEGSERAVVVRRFVRRRREPRQRTRRGLAAAATVAAVAAVAAAAVAAAATCSGRRAPPLSGGSACRCGAPPLPHRCAGGRCLATPPSRHRDRPARRTRSPAGAASCSGTAWLLEDGPSDAATVASAPPSVGGRGASPWRPHTSRGRAGRPSWDAGGTAHRRRTTAPRAARARRCRARHGTRVLRRRATPCPARSPRAPPTASRSGRRVASEGGVDDRKTRA